MANQRMQIDLIFNANTQSALNNIQQLNNILNQISTNTTIGIQSGSLDKAVQSAQQLQTHLAQAVNVDTGKLDLNKLNTSLKQAGTNLQTLTQNLQGAGAQGQQAFIKLANSIASAQTPMLQINQKLKDFGTTLLNTVKWQLASNMIHGIQGAIEGAINYAKDLNGALNDIRIVTGKSIDDMSEFAATASKAAKELNSTTTEYAKAALIFYQQGLEGKAVEDRAEVVLKLAQVTGESAEIISDQMTAIWNNFYDGSKSLEYYADVLTALGAATASSSDEIVQGLEKFAAVADTVGLSYEYAAASLATVVAETRQAPEVVGTAFKTLFARLQGLSLGETLEDGTDLNKYSEALATVGVEIKNQYGELKKADVILEETANKWNLLGEDQQVALAQTVGGMRQYSQFIALMENWDKVEMNVDIAELSEGELTKQQEIWSESWEAANKRVEQSKNDLYSKIIDDNTIIKLTDVWSELIDRVGDFIDRMGGVGGTVMFLVNIFSKQLFPIIQNVFTRLANNISVLTGSAQKQVFAMQDVMRQEMAEMSAGATPAMQQQLTLSDKLIVAKQELARTSKNMSIAERELAERRMANIENMANEIQKSLELQTQLEDEISAMEKKAMASDKYKESIGQEATKTGERENLSEEEYEKTYGASRENIIDEAKRKRPISIKQSLKELDESGINNDTIEQKKTELSKLRENIPKHGGKTNDETLERIKLLEQEIEKEEKILQEQEQKKRKLEEILYVQEKMSKEDKASFGKSQEFVLPEDQKTNSYLGGIQQNVAEQLGGSVEPVEGEKGATMVVADASIENLKKAYALQGKYQVALKKTNAVTKDLTKAKNQEKNALKQVAEQQKKATKGSKEWNTLEKQKTQIQKQTIQSYQNSKNAITQLAQSANLTDTEMEELNMAFKQLDQGGEEAVQGMSKIDSILDNLGYSFKEADAGVDLLIESFASMLSGKIPDDELIALREKLKEAGINGAIAADKMDQFNGALNRNQASSGGFAKTLGNITTTTMQVVGAIQGAVMAFQSLGNAFNEDATPMENFSNYLMGIMGLLPMVSTAIQLYTSIHSKNSKKRIADNTAEQVSDAATAGGSTLKGAIQSFGVPAGPIIGGVLAAAVVAMILGGVFSALSANGGSQSKEEKKEEALGESINELTSQLEAAKGAAEGFKSAVSEYDDGIAAIGELTKGTQEYYDAIEAANEKARELIETYGLTQDAYHMDAEGIIQIDEEALENKQAEYDQRVLNTSTQLNLDKAAFEQVSAENAIKDTELEVNGSDIIDSTKMMLAQAAADYGVNEAGVALQGEELKTAILQGLSGTIDYNTAEAYLNLMDTEGINTLQSFGESLRNASDSADLFAETILNDLSKAKYDSLTTELAGDDTGLKELMDGALQSINDNAVDEEGISKSANDIFDKAKEEGSYDWDDMTDDDLTYTKKDGTTQKVKGELGYMVAAAEDIGGEGFSLQSAADYKAVLGEYLSDEMAAKLAKGEDVQTADLAKAYYEAQGYTDVEVSDDNGVVTVSATGSEALGLEDIEDKEIENEDAASDFADLLKSSAVQNAISNGMLSNEDAETLLKELQSVNSSNDYGADFTKSILAAAQNEEHTFDFAGVFGDLSANEVEEIKSLSSEELMELFGLDEESLKQLFGEGFSSADLQENVLAGLSEWDEETYIKDAKAAGVAAAEELELDTAEFEAYRDAIQSTTDAYDDNLEGLNEVTIANQRLDRGTKKLADSWEDIDKILSNGSATAGELATVMPTVNEGLQDMLNLSDEEFELLSPDFARKNWGLIQDVVNGVEGAVDDLRDAAGQDILLNVKGAVDENGKLKEGLSELNAEIASFDDKQFEVGVAIDDTQFLQTCQNMIDAAGMTADEAKGYFSSMGYDAEIEERKVETTTTRTVEYPIIDERTGYPTGETKTMKLKEVAGTTAYAIKSITPNGSYGGGIGVNTTASSTSTNSNEGEETEAAEPVKKSDTVERYKEINDQLEDISRNLDKINDKMDDAYGQARLDAMDEYITNLEKENKALEKKGQEIERNIAEDQQTVADAAAGVGMSVEFDENGNIANATQIENAWYDRLASATTKEEQDEIQGYIDVWEDAQGDYEDSLNEFWDNEDAKRENRRKQQEKEFEKWNYKIELDVELDEGELALIDYYQNKLSDDIYGMAESVALTGQEVDITLGNLVDREKQYAELTSLYESGKISQAQYAEGLKELQEAELEDLETLQQLQEEMEEYYANTLAMASEELDKYTARLERSTVMLEHYQDLLDLTGQGQNYDAMGKVLDAQQRTINNQYESSKKEYEMYKRQADDSYQKMLNATTDEDRERYKKEWEEAEQYANDAQDRTVDNAKKKAEIAAAIYENTLNRLNKQMETALTNGRSFDEVSMQMEHQQSLQEEYLTTTNKIYETTKMMRNLQNEIDKTTNRVAKQKLKAFQQETKQLQEQGKLSKFELDIQQAKYDLLLAEIALEEAQNAKSTVRLQRDSEGNFGYVYTADQEKVSGAEQTVDDAKNALYNVQLEGANNYAEQSFQLQQEGLDALKELNESYRAGDITSEEEYQRRREEIINYYTQRLTDVSNLYGIAVADDSRVAADAWSTNITNLVTDVDTWKTETNKYTSEVDQAFSTLNTELAKIAKEMGLNIEDLTKTISNVTKESDKWAKKMQDDVIPDMEDTIDEVKTLADALLKKLTPQIKDAAKKGEILAEKMYKTQKKLSGLAGEAEKSASRAANVAGSWREYWNAVNNVDGSTSTTTTQPGDPKKSPGDDDKKDPTKTRGSTSAMGMPGHDWKFKVGDYAMLGSSNTYAYDSYRTTEQFNFGNYQNGLKILGYNMVRGLYPMYKVKDTSGNVVWVDESRLVKPWRTITKFDTGGYTGEWGNEGKLAALHEKELVLNKEDTANFLASLELLHNIIKMIDMNTSNSLINRLDSANLKTNKSNDVLEQHVTIEAVFPNVEDRYEIEEAFMNLTNEASQYINRKNN